MSGLTRQIIVLITYAITLVINSMASSGALGGTPTGDISNAYPIYFVPANLTFGIWGVIYLGLTAFAVYQALPSQRENPIIKKISWPFVLSNIANTLWLILFQDERFVLSLPVMVIILGSLIAIYRQLEIGRAVSRATFWLIQVPFSIYLGWITIATIANVAQAFFANGYEDLGLGGANWAAIMIVIGTGIIALVIYTGKGNVAYALTTIWAIVGIVIKQGERSTLIGATAIIAIVAIAAVLAYSWLKYRGERAPTRAA
jgi:benzodiazapine receptor